MQERELMMTDNNSDKWSNMTDEEREQRAKERAARNPIYRSAGEGEVAKEQLEELPDRQMAERNSVYKLAGEDVDEERLKNLPDRQMAERNSVYKLAGEEGERDNSPYHLNEQEPNRPGGYTPRSRQNERDVTSNSQVEPENSLPETVSLNTEPIDRPSKLDTLTRDNQGTMTQPQTTQGSRAVAGEHSQVTRGGGSTPSEWQREAEAAATDTIVPGASDTSSTQNRVSGLTIPSAQTGPRNAPSANTTDSVDLEYDTRPNMSARGDGDTARHGEHSEVDRYSNGGTTQDWMNLPSSTYKGVAGITDKDRTDGEMSLNWDGTASSEHPNNPEEGSDIRNRSSGGSTSQQSSIG